VIFSVTGTQLIMSLRVYLCIYLVCNNGMLDLIIITMILWRYYTLSRLTGLASVPWK